MIYPTKDCKYDVGVWCQNFHEIDGRLASLEGDTATSVLVNTVSGENVCVNGTVEAPFSDIKLYGKSVQETVPGNNLYNSSFRLNYGSVYCIHGSATELDGVYTIIVTAKDCYINGHCDAGSSYVQENGYLAEIPEGVTQLHVNISNSAFIKNMVSIFDGDKISLGWVLRNTSNFVVDLSAYPTAKYITLRFGLPDTISSGTYETTVMINAGSTALPWEPYCGGIPSPNPDYPQEIKSVVVAEVKVCGKNLCKGVTQNIFINSGANLCGVSSGDSGVYIRVKSRKYTISTNTTQERYRIACVNAIPTTVNVPCYNGVIKDGKSDSVTIDCSEYEYLIVNATDLTAIQIEEGTVATDYEPYTENTVTLSQPITLHGIGDVMDELTPDGVVRKFFVYNNPSTTSVTPITLANNKGNGYRILCNLPLQAKQGTKLIFSNAFVFNGDRTLLNSCSISNSGEVIYFVVSETDFPNLTVNAINEWMEEVGLYFVYELATPITEPLPEADQMALRSLHSYDGVTHVMCEAEMEVGCLVDTKFYIDSKFAELAAKLGV